MSVYPVISNPINRSKYIPGERPVPTNSYFSNSFVGSGTQTIFNIPYTLNLHDTFLQFGYGEHFKVQDTWMQLYPLNNWQINIRSKPNAQKNITDWGSGYFTAEWNRFSSIFVKGSMFLTFEVNKTVSIKCLNNIKKMDKIIVNFNKTKYIIKLDNNQVWYFYFDKDVTLTNKEDVLSVNLKNYTMYVVLANDNNYVSDSWNKVLDKYYTQDIKSCKISYYNNDNTILNINYKWNNALGEVLLVTLPHHRKYMNLPINSNYPVYKCILGDLIPVITKKWTLTIPIYEISWHSQRTISPKYKDELNNYLNNEPHKIYKNNTYYFGKEIAKYARICLIAEQNGNIEAKIKSLNFIKENLIPWLNGSAPLENFRYDTVHKGINVESLASDTRKIVFNEYNDHHYHLGYFIYAIAVIVKNDLSFYNSYKDQINSLVQDYACAEDYNHNFPMTRMKDWYNGHSWASGLSENSQGKNQESPSEAVNSYYAIKLLGNAIGDSKLELLGTALMWTEIITAQMYWQIIDNDYVSPFNENTTVGILWQSKLDYNSWFGNYPELINAVQILPFTPASEALINKKWVQRISNYWSSIENETLDDYNAFFYLARGLINPQDNLQKIRNLMRFDNGNSASNCFYSIITQFEDISD